MKFSHWNNRGFTLVETLITLAIMSTLTVMTARTIQHALKSKAKIQEQLDNVTQIRDVAKLLERDIQLAYHASDLEKELALLLSRPPNTTTGTNSTGGFGINPNGAQKNQAATLQPNEVPNIEELQNPPPSQNPNQPNHFQTDNRFPPNTHFIGKESELHFVTRNVIRLMKDSPQSDLAEVGYFLDSCKVKADKNDDSGKCLFRRFSPLLDKDVTRGGRAQQIMDHVAGFELKYYSKAEKDWVSQWRSDEKAEAATKGFFPEAVEITLTMNIPKKEKSQKDRKMALQLMVPLHFPNNPEIKK